ncbi:MAG: universal stress protein [Rhodospirillaceae bacterium]
MYAQILVPVDLDNRHDWSFTLPKAISFVQAAQSTGQRTMLHVMSVVPQFGMSLVGQFFPQGFESEMSDKVLEMLKAKTAEVVPKDLPHRHIVAEGTVYEAVLSMSRKVNADLIVIGSHRPELKDYLLGPNAARVVRHASCSVLVVRH